MAQALGKVMKMLKMAGLQNFWQLQFWGDVLPGGILTSETAGSKF